jgi:ABC-type sugar transport system ATPase subunit
MGTRIVVMKAGYVQQIDTPMNLYDKPYNQFVAGFIGTPQMNFFDVKLQRKGDKVNMLMPDESTVVLNYDSFAKVHGSYLDGEKDVIFGIRPDHIILSEKDTGLKVRVTAVEHLGNESIIYGNLGEEKKDFTMKDEGKSIIIKDTNNTKVEVDDVVFIGFKEDRIHLFDKSTQVTLILDVPASNYVKAELDGDTLSVLNGKVKLPAAVLAKLEGHKDLALEIAPSAIVKGNSLKLKVKRVEQVDDKYLAHLVYEDHYVFALVDEKVKEGDTYAFDVEFDKVKAFDGEEELLAPIGENEHLDGKFVKKDINRKEVEFYYVIGGTQISDTLGNGFKINSVDGNECYSKTYKYVFNRDKVVVGQGEIKATALELLDYGHVKYVKAKVGEEELLLVVPEGLELSNGQEFSFDVKGEDVEVWDKKHNFRIC